MIMINFYIFYIYNPVNEINEHISLGILPHN